MFMSQFLQTCLDLGKNVPSDTLFTLNNQLSTSSLEQFQVKFMARSTAVSSWLTRVHGLAKADIDAREGDPEYIPVHMLVEEANAEYAMPSPAEHWGPKGKQDIDVAPAGLYTKAELNLLVQKQVSAAGKQFQSKTSNKNNESTKANNPNNKSHKGDKKMPWIPKQARKPQSPAPGTSETKVVDGKTWNWLQHHGFWQLAHGTADHKDPSTLPPRGSSVTPSVTASTTMSNVAMTGLQFCDDIMSGEE